MEIGGGSGSSIQVIPERVMEAVKRTSSNIDEVKANLEEFMSCCDTETLSRMEPLERAQALFLIAKATTTLFALRLRCKGVDPDDHPVKKEIERLNVYQEKLQKSMDLSKAPLRPSATINPQAAARFIEHSLPDLSAEQKQSMRTISRGEGTRTNYLDRSLQKKRKYQSPEKQSVRSAAQEFLEKAARELLGDNKNGVKGPLQPEDSDDDVIILD
ncbi:DNA-binding protein C1D involved in regulation of double-strand break repair [Handroanthus impetiginosus]|uniref:Nuclear nucleic acid-binding protein C1D n=1 Tax=Handroanthus impetiginosus TaxID=429701 RepID=A0A2G9H4K2_9LAMI|nr:DNA-binding protein C1D involved in regulation of double-strand break repair [Handroanthus impetiginosus]